MYRTGHNSFAKIPVILIETLDDVVAISKHAHNAFMPVPHCELQRCRPHLQSSRSTSVALQRATRRSLIRLLTDAVVYRTEVTKRLSAPARSSSRAMSSWPRNAASCSALKPSDFVDGWVCQHHLNVVLPESKHGGHTSARLNGRTHAHRAGSHPRHCAGGARRSASGRVSSPSRARSRRRAAVAIAVALL